jgi:hypothetical protein
MLFETYKKLSIFFRQNKEDPNKEDPNKEDPNKEDPNKEDQLDLLVVERLGRLRKYISKLLMESGDFSIISQEELLLICRTIHREMIVLLIFYSLNEWDSPAEKFDAMKKSFLKDKDHKISIEEKYGLCLAVFDTPESRKEYWESFEEVPLTKKGYCEFIRFKTLEFIQISEYYSEKKSIKLGTAGYIFRPFLKKIDKILSLSIKD